MQSRASLILMITYFFPVAVFSVIARIGEPSLTQAKLAVTIGLLLDGDMSLLLRMGVLFRAPSTP
jgi:hypothetical protein